MLIIIHSGVLYLRKIITIMEESPSDKIHKTFRDDLLSNIFEAKNDYLGTPEWLAKPFSLPPNLELANTLARIETSQSIASPNPTFADFTPQILTEFEPRNNIHEEQDKKIEKLENKFSKFVTQVRKLSKKFDDLRNDTHNSIEYMAKQFDILANDVDVLTALVEDDEKE